MSILADKTTRARLLIATGVLIAGSLLSWMLGGDWRVFAMPAMLGLAAAVGIALLMPSQVPASRTQDEPDADARLVKTPLLNSLSRQIGDSQAEIDDRALGSHYRRQQREEFEKVVDGVLNDFIAVIRARLDVHTVAIFFPTADNGYRIQKCASKSEFVDRDAVIYPGVGVIGSFLKDGLKQLKLNEIMSDSKTLYYYTRDVGVRSVLGCPLVAAGSVRGWILVDSTEASFFTDEHHTFLSHIATILSQTVYFTYSCAEYKIQHDRLVAMTNTEKAFFTHLDRDAVLDRMAEIIPFAVHCDRLSISLKLEELPRARVVRVHGEHTEKLLDMEFDLDERGLVPLVYSRKLGIFRDFAADHYEVRYADNEAQRREFKSFMALPIGVSECRGTLLLESVRPDAFSSAHRDLLDRFATSAGLALEKLQNLEQAQALATHDGLTGLFNHRHFQKLLQDHLNRTKRYNEPLALILCDIDHFKRCNDTYGHPFGDIVLKGVSEKLRESIRTGGDVAARYGGEEFALVLLKTDLAGAKETAERIREMVAKASYREPRGEEVHVTMSFGIALYGEHATATDALIKRADQALYRAKSNGRNRVEVF